MIAKAEERDQFKEAMEKIGLDVCKGFTIGTLEQARAAPKRSRATSRRSTQLHDGGIGIGDRLQQRRI